MKQEVISAKDIIGDNLKLAWYFDKPLEKIMIVLSFLCLILTILRVIITGEVW